MIEYQVFECDINQWLPVKILEASVLRDVLWVRIYYPDGTILERPRNKELLRITLDETAAWRIKLQYWWETIQLRRKWRARG